MYSDEPVQSTFKVRKYQNSISFCYPMLLKQLLYSQIELLNWPQKRLICSSDLVQTAEENNKTTCNTIGPRRKKPGLRGADQPGLPRRLISAFVFRILESIISNLAANEISFFQLVSMADETGLSLALSETPKKGVVAPRPYLFKKIMVRFRPQAVERADESIHQYEKGKSICKDYLQTKLLLPALPKPNRTLASFGILFLTISHHYRGRTKLLGNF